MQTPDNMTIRWLNGADEPALRRLAERDSAGKPDGAVLGALDGGGSLIAALGLETRALIADPFVPSAAAAELLRLRASQLRSTGEGVRGELAQCCSSGAIVSPAASSCSQ